MNKKENIRWFVASVKSKIILLLVFASLLMSSECEVLEEKVVDAYKLENYLLNKTSVNESKNYGVALNLDEFNLKFSPSSLSPSLDLAKQFDTKFVVYVIDEYPNNTTGLTIQKFSTKVNTIGTNVSSIKRKLYLDVAYQKDPGPKNANFRYYAIYLLDKKDVNAIEFREAGNKVYEQEIN